MRRTKTLAAAAALLVTACNTAPSGTWTRPGATAQDLQQDSYECERDAMQSNFQGLSGIVLRNRFEEHCMEAHGWAKAP